MDKDILLKKSMKSLEWPALLAQLATKACSEAGKELCLKLLPEPSKEKVAELQTETAEMVDFLHDNSAPIVPPFTNMQSEISQTNKQVILDPLALRKILTITKISGKTKHTFQTVAAKPYRLLTELSIQISETQNIRNEIERAIDDQGNIRESASPELGKLYSDKRRVRDVVTSKLEPYLSGEQYSTSLREKYFTVREERYVIPVKSEMQKKVDGIIHDSSQSGMTLFVEPKELIPLNNKLRLFNLKIEKEVKKILGRLSALVAEKAEELISNIKILGYLDLLQAKAQLASVMEATKPEISKDGKIDIKEGRHPLLALQAGNTVSNSINVGNDAQVLVISGPNTGGKTVLLKMVGILSLMLRAGLQIPASEGSKLPVFTEVYADIGDEQTISGSLSTFAGHLKNVSGMMHNLSSSSLVLLDEFMASTDPTEGCALAEAILDDFVSQGSIALVTTHFSSLKFIATEKEHFLNGSMEIDPVTLHPTYKLIQGIPGRSHALDIAKRLGMNNDVLLAAERSLGHDDRNIEKLIKTIASERKELQTEKEQVEKIKREAQLLTEEARRIKDDLKEKKLSFKRERVAALKKEIGTAREEIQAAVAAVKSKQTDHSAEKAMRALKDIELSGEAPPDNTGCTPLFSFKEGDNIYIPALKISGTVLSGPSKKNVQKICAGQAEITLNSKSTYGKKLNKPASNRQAKPSSRLARSSASTLNSKNCSLRGLTQEVALEKLTEFLDKAIQHEVHSVTVIHGHGTGVLKKSVREYLRSSPYSDSFSPGLANEGGDGVTVVKLKST